MYLMPIEEELKNAPIPHPTNTYTPISHAEIIEATHEECENYGFKIVDKKYFTDRVKNKMTAKYTLASQDSEVGCMIAFQNSYDKSMSVKYATGGSVFVCSNGMVVGDYTFKSKHQGHADTHLRHFIQHAIRSSERRFGNVLELKDNFKRIQLTDKSMQELAGKMFLQGDLLRMNQLSHFQKEYLNPTFNYNVDKNNLWNIYNLCTDSIEQFSHPTIYLKQHADVVNFLKKEFEIC